MIDCGDADAIDLLMARFYWELHSRSYHGRRATLYNTGRVDPCRALYDRVFAPIIAAIGSSPGTTRSTTSDHGPGRGTVPAPFWCLAFARASGLSSKTI